MHRKLKVLGVTLVALFALSAVAASSALATEGVLTPGAFPATITASQIENKTSGNPKFTVGSAAARTVECKIAKLDSTTTVSNSTTSTLAFGTDFTECITSPGGGPATVKSTGCDISVTLTNRLTASTGEGSGGLSGTSCDLSIVANSTAGSRICEYTIPNQSASGSFTWASAASTPDDVIVSFNTTGVSTINVLFGSLAACGAEAGKSTIGKLDGEYTVTAEVGSTPTSLTIS